MSETKTEAARGRDRETMNGAAGGAAGSEPGARDGREPTVTPKMRQRRACGFIAGALVLACAVAGIIFLVSINVRPLPSLEIIFQVAPVPLRDGVDAGVTNSDGTRVEYLELRSGLPFLPAWSPGGNAIAYRWGPANDGAATYDQGLIEFRKARGWYYSTTRDCTRRTWGWGRIRWTPNGDGVLTAVFTEDGKHTLIVLINPSSCQISQILAQSSDGEDLFDPDLSVSGQLAFTSRPRVALHGETIVVMNLQTREKQVIAEGISPAWSPDGEWLAFTALDGIWLMRADGADRRQVVDWTAYWPEPWTWRWDGYYDPEGWPARPEWSPDGKWIVYHRLVGQANGQQKFAIFKMNVETGEEVKVVDDGINPHWRWDTPVAATK